jgi:hypothetical protein
MFYDITVVQASKMLGNLKAMLEKAAEFAEAKKIEPEVLLTSRLAPDQFPLVRQVQMCCDTAKLGAARLAGKQTVHQNMKIPKRPWTSSMLVSRLCRIIWPRIARQILWIPRRKKLAYRG